MHTNLHGIEVEVQEHSMALIYQYISQSKTARKNLFRKLSAGIGHFLRFQLSRPRALRLAPFTEGLKGTLLYPLWVWCHGPRQQFPVIWICKPDVPVFPTSFNSYGGGIICPCPFVADLLSPLFHRHAAVIGIAVKGDISKPG